MAKDSQYLRLFRYHIWNIKETGLYDRLYRRRIAEAVLSCYNDLEGDSEGQGIGLGTTHPAFYYLLCGLILALVTITFEFFYHTTTRRVKTL